MLAMFSASSPAGSIVVGQDRQSNSARNDLTTTGPRVTWDTQKPGGAWCSAGHSCSSYLLCEVGRTDLQAHAQGQRVDELAVVERRAQAVVGLEEELVLRQEHHEGRPVQEVLHARFRCGLP